MDKRNKIMICQYNFAIKDFSDNIKYCLSENTNVWYVLIYNLKGDKNEFESGEYLCRLVAPKEFPYAPPEFYFMTPNGVYDVERKVCISIGEFHKKNYIQTLKMSGFAINLISGLIGWKELGEGISLLHTTEETKKEYAAKSKQFNDDNYKEIINKINTEHNLYSKAWTKK